MGTSSRSPSCAARPFRSRFRWQSRPAHYSDQSEPQLTSSSQSHSRVRPGRALPEALRKPLVFSQDPQSIHLTKRLVDDIHGSTLAGGREAASQFIRDGSEDEACARDEPGTEMGPQARVWHIYVREATKADAKMTEGWNRSMDVHLVFAGLFSAVLTTFLVQSYTTLSPDPANTTNVLLTQLIITQKNISEGVPIDISGIFVPPAFANSAQTRWVNGLWFAALSCSLASALVSLLAKHWLDSYLLDDSGSLQDRARTRQSRFMQFEVWGVSAVINSLSMLLHVSLLLFFVGLSILLWMSDIIIAIAAMTVMVSAYLFYSASVWLPLLYPACPYRHPISHHLQRLFHASRLGSEVPLRARRLQNTRDYLLLRHSDPEKSIGLPELSSSRTTRDDALDAEAICWLLRHSTDREVLDAALKSLAGLRRDFTAIDILREHGALQMIEDGFQRCFYKDTSVDIRWHLAEAHGAELFCKAWLRLTWNTSEQWPLEMIEPLWVLQDMDECPNGSAIASCAIALSSFDSAVSQWELLAYLSKFLTGQLQLSDETLCWLLDSMSQCLIQGELSSTARKETYLKAIPILLFILHATQDQPNTAVRTAASVTLYIITHGPNDVAARESKERRQTLYFQRTLQALSTITADPNNYGAEDSFLDLTAHHLAILASYVVAQSHRLPSRLRAMARESLSKLFMDGRIVHGTIPDAVLADVLQVIYPPNELTPSQVSCLVVALLETLKMSSHGDVSVWTIQLLEVLLTRCTIAATEAFIHKDGIQMILRAAKAGSVNGHRMQINAVRSICAFVESVVCLYDETSEADIHAHLDEHVDILFRSAFFETLCSFAASRRSWLFEVSTHWMPVLVHLCRLRPNERVWESVVRTFTAFAERNVEEEGCLATFKHLEQMREIVASKSTSGMESWTCQTMVHTMLSHAEPSLNYPFMYGLSTRCVG